MPADQASFITGYEAKFADYNGQKTTATMKQLNAFLSKPETISGWVGKVVDKNDDVSSPLNLGNLETVTVHVTCGKTLVTISHLNISDKMNDKKVMSDLLALRKGQWVRFSGHNSFFFPPDQHTKIEDIANEALSPGFVVDDVEGLPQ